jgi:hypothetical protein
MPVIHHIDGVAREVHLDPLAAVGGVISFHPVDDLYVEYRELRRLDESLRAFVPFMEAAGNVPKGGGKFTPRYLVLLGGTKIVIPAGITTVNVTGELLTDDQSYPFDTSLVSSPLTINYAPAEAEVIKIVASGNEYSLVEIANAVLAQLMATYIPVDAKRVNGETVIGDGSEADPWRAFGVPP